MKKILVFCLCALFIADALPVFAQQEPQPQSNGAQNAAILIGGLGATNLTLKGLSGVFGDVPFVGSLLEESQKAIAGLMRKRFFDMVVDQIVNWIQGGGEPQFIQNWDSFLASYGNIVTGDLVKELGLGAVCRPFGIQLQVAIMQPPRFSRQVSCTLDQIVGNMVNFYNNFRTGGFVAYREIWQPQNNFYGSLIMAMNEKETRIADQRFAGLQEALANNGFLGTRKCDEFGRCYIVTPGMQIGAAAAKVVGADLDYIIGIPQEDLAAYTAAISDAFINRLVREGVGGFQAVVAANVPPIGYIPEQPKNHAPCAGLTGSALNGCQALQATQTNNIELARQAYLNELNATLVPLQDAEQNILAAIDIEQRLITAISGLLACQTNRNSGDKNQTTNSLTAEQLVMNNLRQVLLGLQQTTIPLVNAKTKLSGVAITDFVALNDTLRSIGPLVNQEKALSYQSSTKAQKETLLAQTTVRINELQTQTTQCAGS